MTVRRILSSLSVIAVGTLLLSCGAFSSYNLTSITTTPATASLGPTGSTTQFTASAYYARSSHSPEIKDVTTQASWTSSNPAVATIDPSGLATAVAVGSTTITASFKGFSSTASLDVTIGAGSLTALTVLPSPQTVYALGQTAQFIAIGSFSTGPATQDTTDQVTWIANDADVATINSTGLATSLPCTTPPEGCNTAITVTFTNPDGTVITATSGLSTLYNTNNAPLPSLTVYKLGQGTGTVVSDPVGINCGTGASCTANFPITPAGVTCNDVGSGPGCVTLTETPTVGTTSVFIGWSSNCNGGTNLTIPTCSVPMQNNQTVGAIFALKPTP
jgi:Bacterial Ig-like domain (group 2)